MKEELKEYYCFNDYIMECPELKGKAAFLKGKKYLFNNQMITKSEVYNEHDLSDEIDFDKHFILQSEWDLLQQKSVEIPKQQLIGMTAFVLEQYKLFIQDKITSEQFRNNVWNYANFLSRQPQLSDFVACGKDGLPLDKKQFHYTEKGLKQLSGIELYIALSINKESEEYQQALDKVLFKGCIAEKINDYYVVKHQDKPIWVSWNTFHKIESLTPYNLELTDNAIKIKRMSYDYNQRQT